MKLRRVAEFSRIESYGGGASELVETTSTARRGAGLIGAAVFAGALALTQLLGQVLCTASAVAASAEKGKIAFVRHGCWQCHGYQGQGGVTGPKLAPDPIPFEALSAFVRTTNRAMPPFSEMILSDADLADIYAYLQSIPKGPDAASIPLLNE